MQVHSDIVGRGKRYFPAWVANKGDILRVSISVPDRKIECGESKQLIWLNPLLGVPGYEPVTRGMSAALPYIDVFAPAHNLESLLQLERHLKVA